MSKNIFRRIKMKKLIVMLILFCVPLLAQPLTPVYQFKSNNKYWDNWDINNKYYVFQVDSGATDSSITSKEFAPTRGFDGLMEFYAEVTNYWTTTSLPDTTYIENGNFQPNGKSDSTTIIVDDTSGVTVNLFSIFERYYGQAIGWKVEDTLQWVLYNNRVVAQKLNSISALSTFYVSQINPIPTDTVDFWMGDPPLPWRVTTYTAVHDTMRTYILKLEFKEHLPNRGQ